jgi:hypothetical protein
MTDIVQYDGSMPSGAEIQTAEKIATNLAASGMFKDARQASQAFAKIMLGRDLGLSPTQAMISIHVVEGKPELSANLQAQLVKTYRGPDGERYDYRVTENTDEACAIEFRRREVGGDWEALGVERFTMADAKTAGLVRANSPWTKYPRNMLWARCISNGVNFHCPEVARGLRVYHEGEIGGGDSPLTPGPPVTQSHVAPADVSSPADESIVDAEVVPDEDKPLTAAGRKKIAKAITDAGIDEKLILQSAGFGSLDDITTVSAAVKVRAELDRMVAA